MINKENIRGSVREAIPGIDLELIRLVTSEEIEKYLLDNFTPEENLRYKSIIEKAVIEIVSLHVLPMINTEMGKLKSQQQNLENMIRDNENFLNEKLKSFRLEIFAKIDYIYNKFKRK